MPKQTTDFRGYNLVASAYPSSLGYTAHIAIYNGDEEEPDSFETYLDSTFPSDQLALVAAIDFGKDVIVNKGPDFQLSQL